MAFNVVNNVAIRGISACVPKHVEENKGLTVFKEGEDVRVMAQTGIERKHVVTPGMCMADLAKGAFDGIMAELGWEKSSIDALVLVSSAADYITPPTSNVLHGLLELEESCLCLDIRQGCPGWIVGMDMVSSLLSNGHLHRAILLCGDLSSPMNSPYDKETRPLFGDTITATALEYAEGAPALEFLHGCRGKDFEAIITPDGGLKNPITAESLEFKEYGTNMVRRQIDCMMDGMGVFAFGISVAPKSVMQLMEHFQINEEDVDCFLFHQANRYMNDKIRKLAHIPEEKVPYSLRDYGNNSGGSIPLTLVTQRREAYQNGKMNSVACAFGVGLAWGCLHFQTENIKCAYVEI